MTHVERIADFVTRASFDALSTQARDQIKIRILDSLGCAIGALEGQPIRPDLAALHNAALGRYLDFNDSYLAKGVVASWWQLRKALADAARGDEVSIYVDGKIYRVVVVEKKRQAEEPHRHRA